MAKGAQDWVNRTDVLVQTLSELIMRNKFGGFSQSDISKVVTANDATVFAALSGKGFIYSALAETPSVATQKNDKWRGTIDGNVSDTPTFDELNKWNIIRPFRGVPHLGLFDEINFKYAMGWLSEVTYESAVQFSYVEAHGRTPTVRLFILLAVL